MKEVLDVNPHVVDYAKEAIKRAGLELKMESIRGGTDGSRLSFMGLPCPNLFAGEQAIHSKLEWISVQDMHKAVETMVHLVQVCEEKVNRNLQFKFYIMDFAKMFSEYWWAIILAIIFSVHYLPSTRVI